MLSSPQSHFTDKNLPIQNTLQNFYLEVSAFFFILPLMTRSCFFLQTEHSSIILFLIPCFFTFAFPLTFPWKPMSFRSCFLVPQAIVLPGLYLVVETFTLCFVCLLQC